MPQICKPTFMKEIEHTGHEAEWLSLSRLHENGPGNNCISSEVIQLYHSLYYVPFHCYVHKYVWTLGGLAKSCHGTETLGSNIVSWEFQNQNKSSINSSKASWAIDMNTSLAKDPHFPRNILQLSDGSTDLSASPYWRIHRRYSANY